MTQEEFKELLERLNNNNFVESSLEIVTEFFDYQTFNERIGDKGTVLLAKALRKNPHITKVTLINQNMADEGAIALSEVDSLEELNLWYNNIHALGLEALARSRLKILSIRENMDIFENFIRSGAEEELLGVIEPLIENKTIIELSLQRTFIPDKLVAELIGRNTTIKILNLSGNYLTDEALKYIENNKTIEYLNLSENHISDIGAGYIAKNTSLKALVINKSNITDAGAKLLSTHPTLQELMMIDSDITPEGAKYFLDSTLSKIVIDKHNKAHFSKRELYKFYHEFADTRKAVLQQQEDNNNESLNENAQIPLSGDDYHIDN